MGPCWLCGLSCPGGLSLTGLVLQGPQQLEKQKVAKPLAPAYQCQAVRGLTGLTVSKGACESLSLSDLNNAPKKQELLWNLMLKRKGYQLEGELVSPKEISHSSTMETEAHNDGSKVGRTIP